MPPLLVLAVSLLGLAAVVWALLVDPELVEEPAPPLPEDWDLLPTPSDLARLELPLRVPGYDPAAVDAAFAALGEIYADLLEVSDEATRRRARQRIAQRLGRIADADAEHRHLPRAEDERARTSAAPPIPESASTEEALRAEAALDAIDEQGR